MDAMRHVLESPAIQQSGLTAYLSTDDDGFFHVDWQGLEELGPTLSTGEVVLVNTAHALYSGQGEPFIKRDDLLFGNRLPTVWRFLDDEHYIRVLEAMAIKRGMHAVVQRTEGL